MEPDESRLERLRAHIASQIDLVASLICDDKAAVGAFQQLEWLTRELVAVEHRLVDKQKRRDNLPC